MAFDVDSPLLRDGGIHLARSVVSRQIEPVKESDYAVADWRLRRLTVHHRRHNDGGKPRSPCQ